MNKCITQDYVAIRDIEKKLHFLFNSRLFKCIFMYKGTYCLMQGKRFWFDIEMHSIRKTFQFSK